MRLFRMFAPEFYLQGVRSISLAVIAATLVVLAMGIILICTVYWPTEHRWTQSWLAPLVDR